MSHGLRARARGLEQLVDGVPLVVVDRGKLRREVMDHMRITDLDLEIKPRGSAFR